MQLKLTVDCRVYQGRGSDYDESETLYYAESLNRRASGVTVAEALENLTSALLTRKDVRSVTEVRHQIRAGGSK
jgi:hypothetical protein